MMSTNLLKHHNPILMFDHGHRRGEPPAPRSRAMSGQLRCVPKSQRRISWNIDRDDKLIKNRKIVDGHLRRLGRLVAKDLSLSTEGICYFPYKKFIIVVEVPEDNGGVVFFYTMCCRLCNGDDRGAVLLEAMKHNFMQCGTRGGSLGVDGDEVNLCFTAPIRHLTADDFMKSLEDFLQTASELNECLEEAKQTLQPKTLR